MERKYYDERPEPFETIRSVGTMITVIRFNVKESEDKEQGMWQSDEVTFAHREPLADDDYGPLVAALVRARFSADAVEAILNNYLGGSKAGQEEFDELQLWRDEAKRTAREVLGYGAE